MLTLSEVEPKVLLDMVHNHMPVVEVAENFVADMCSLVIRTEQALLHSIDLLRLLPGLARSLHLSGSWIGGKLFACRLERRRRKGLGGLKQCQYR